jgi:hypothetical protein
MTSEEFTKATEGLPPAQAALVSSFTDATTAVGKAQLKFKEMGVTAFDASGKFVGMGSIIEQLHPKFAQMTQDQQLAAATTLFGAGAARQMVQVIDAGPAAYDKATASVNKNGAAHAAAAKQAQTLHGEEKTLEAEMGDLATKVGSILIPIITAMVGWFVKATTFVADHKAALIALAAVVTGILGPAIAVFTINKMAAFGQSFVTAAGHVSSFASGVKTAVSKVIGLFADQSAAAEESAGKIATSTEATSGSVATEATAIEGSNDAIDTSFEGTSAAAGTASAEIGTAEVATAGEVATADSAIEAENAAAGGSFGAITAGATGALAALSPLLGALGVVTGGVVGGNAIAGATGASPTQQQGVETPGSTVGGAHIPGTSSGGSLPLVGHVGGPAGAVLGFLEGNIDSAHRSATATVAHKGSTDKNTASVDKLTAATTALTGHYGGGAGASETLAGASSRGARGSAKIKADTGLPGFSASQSQTAQQLMAIFTGAGLSKAGAAGLIGNFAQESSLNLNEPGGLLAQWGGSRLTGEQDYAAAHHESSTSIGAESGFVLQELQSYPALLAELKSTTDTRQAALDISNQYERPDAALANNANREGQAAAALAAFGGVTPTSPTASIPAVLETPAEKAAAKKASYDKTIGTIGTDETAKLVAAAHTGTLAELKKDLDAIHTKGIDGLEKLLTGVHTKAMSELEQKLVAAHDAALAKESTLEAEAAEAAEKKAAAAALSARITALGKQTSLVGDAAKAQADGIADSTKVYLDKQAAVGLTGAALVAANAQTSLDQVTQANDQAIDAAQTKVDGAANGSKLSQAQAANQLARANATATIQEATAQSVLDKANAAATAASSTSTATTTTTTNAPQVNLNIYGNGNMTTGQLFSEIGFAVRSGSLPVAPPPVAAAA